MARPPEMKRPMLVFRDIYDSFIYVHTKAKKKVINYKQSNFIVNIFIEQHERWPME